MYAVIEETGSFQHKVEVGKTIQIQKLEAEVGSVIEFDKVLLVADQENVTVGQPFISGAKVKAEIVAQERADKINIIKFKRRKHHMKRQGHRQYITVVKIVSIEAA